MIALTATACGYSQEEWDQKVRENDKLKKDLSAEQQEHAAAIENYEKAQAEVGELKKTLLARGVDIDNLQQSVEQQELALAEFRKRAEALEQVRQRLNLLRERLQKLTAMGLSVEVRNNMMLINLPGDVLFSSGSDKINKEAFDALDGIAEVIHADAELKKRHYQVAGHTDSKPLNGGVFKDNWGLSAMRARSVVTYLTGAKAKGKGGGLDPTFWSAAGFGSIEPVASNDTAEGRAQNRRVEIVIQPDMQEMLNIQLVAAE